MSGTYVSSGISLKICFVLRIFTFICTVHDP